MSPLRQENQKVRGACKCYRFIFADGGKRCGFSSFEATRQGSLREALSSVVSRKPRKAFPLTPHEPDYFVEFNRTLKGGLCRVCSRAWRRKGFFQEEFFRAMAEHVFPQEVEIPEWKAQ